MPCFCQCFLNLILAQRISLIIGLEYPETSRIGLAAFSYVGTSVPLDLSPLGTESPIWIVHIAFNLCPLCTLKNAKVI